MVLGNVLIALLSFQDSTWKYYIYVFPANMGQGMVYPGILFTILATFEHSGKGLLVLRTDDKSTNRFPRSRRFSLDRLSHSITWHSVGSRYQLRHCAEHSRHTAPGGIGGCAT